MIAIMYAPISTGTPAKIYPKLRTMVIDPATFYQIPSFNMRVFVLAHELAHLRFRDETEADLEAFRAYYERGYPVRDAIFALTRLLEPTNAHKRVVGLINGIYAQCH